MATATSTPFLLENRGSLERSLGRALGLGAVAGAVSLLSHALPLGCLAVMAAGLACVRGALWDRILLVGLSVAGQVVTYLLGLQGGWPLAVSGAFAGALMVRAHRCEVARSGGRGEAVHPFRYPLGMLLGATLAVAGGEIARTLGDGLLGTEAPRLLVSAFAGAVLSLFVALASTVAHLSWGGGTSRALPTGLSGELRDLALRALAIHAQCQTLFQRIPAEPARDELSRVLDGLVDDGLELAAEWSALEQVFGELHAARLPQQVEQLARSAAATSDSVARAQLLGAAQTLGDQLVQLDDLALRRERVLAKLSANVALLESARLSLSTLSSSRSQLKVAELSVLSRRLQSLVSHQATEAEANDSVSAEVMMELSLPAPAQKTH